MQSTCRFPKKQKHKTYAAAQATIWSLRRRGKPDCAFLEVIKCGKHYHLGRDWTAMKMYKKK